MITVESRPSKKRAPSANEEAKLQTECNLWYLNEWRIKPKNLWTTFNEGKNVGQRLSMGMVAGVSDRLYYESWNRGLIGLEFKFPNTKHDVNHLITQALWISDVCDTGGFVDNLAQFQRIIRGENCWYSPEKVIEYCRSVKTGSIVWKSELFR